MAPSQIPTGSPWIRNFINAVAALYQVPSWDYRNITFHPGCFLEGLIYHEGYIWLEKARRYEKHQDIAPDADRPGVDDGKYEEDASYGPMQVMGSNVRRLHELPLEARMNYALLNDWLLGCGYGMIILQQELRSTGGNVERALARYNGGPRGELPGPDGQMRRQVYVDAVFEKCRLVMLDRAKFSAGLPSPEEV